MIIQAEKEWCMKIDLIGRVYVKDVIIFYDEPMMFSCVNDFGNYFIANCIDSDEKSKYWLFLPISEARLIKGLRGNISAYDLFKNSEGGFLWSIIEPLEGGVSKAQQVQSMLISDEDLPTRDSYINFYEDEMLKAKKEDIVVNSQKERREILDISLEPNGSHEHEIACETMAKTLNDTQKIVYLIADKKGVNSNKIPEVIKRENILNVSGTFAASFGIRLKSDNLSSISGYSKLQDNIKIFMDILDAKSDINKIKSILDELNPAVGIVYNRFLRNLEKSNLGIKTTCAFPDEYTRSISLTHAEIVNSINALKGEIEITNRIIELNGELVGANSFRKSFEFITIEDEKISGVIGDNVKIDEYILPKKAKMKVQVQVSFNDITNKEDTKYTLLELSYKV